MRVAILHAAGDEALAQQASRELEAGEALLAPLSPTLCFGPHLILLILWTARSLDHADDVRRIAEYHDAIVLWRADGTPAPAGVSAVSTIGPDSSLRAIEPALRLAGMSRARPQGDSPGPRTGNRGVLAVALGVGAVVALGAAGATAVMLDRDAPQKVFASRPASSPRDDLRPTSSVEDQQPDQNAP